MGIGQAITMPLFFSSSALYPAKIMPGWLQVISKVNPLSYEVEALRGLLIGTATTLWLDVTSWSARRSRPSPAPPCYSPPSQQVRARRRGGAGGNASAGRQAAPDRSDSHLYPGGNGNHRNLYGSAIVPGMSCLSAAMAIPAPDRRGLAPCGPRLSINSSVPRRLSISF